MNRGHEPMLYRMFNWVETTNWSLRSTTDQMSLVFGSIDNERCWQPRNSTSSHNVHLPEEEAKRVAMMLLGWPFEYLPV